MSGLRERLEDLLGAEGVGAFRPELPASAGSAPTWTVAAPSSEGEWQAVLELARTDGLEVLPLGTGSKLSWRALPERVDLVLSTLRWEGVTSYEPGDGTLSAKSGTKLAHLEEVTRQGGHALTPLVPDPDQATLGGVVAAGQSGLDRLARGPLRNHLLGTRVLLADGSLAKSGGQLVKNVTGYDLHRLYCGSHGTLCVVLEASLRLFALPESHASLSLSIPDRTGGLALARHLLTLSARPSWIVLEGAFPAAGEGWELRVGFAGKEAVIDQALGDLPEAFAAARILRGAEARRDAAAVRGGERGGGRWSDLRLECLPAKLAERLAAVEAELLRRGLEAKQRVQPALAAAELWITEASGVALAGGEPRIELDRQLRHPEALLRWRPPLAAPAPAGAAVMASLRRALDPDGRFAGELVPARMAP